MINLRSSASCLTACLLVGGSAMADRPEKASEVVAADNCKSVELQLDFSAGSIQITPADMSDLARVDIYYTPRSVRYNVDKSVRGDKCVVFLESERRRGWSSGDESENEWTVQLSKKYPTAIDMDIGACEGRMDLGGIPLTDLTLDIGAADLQIDFSSPNPSRLRDFSVDCGASSLEILGLANANVGAMEFDVGAGSCEIDLRGEIKGEIEIDISVGVGSMDIIVSRDAALRVEGDDKWFSSIDFHGLDMEEHRKGIWETANFEGASDRIVISADVAMGSVSIYARK